MIKNDRSIEITIATNYPMMEQKELYPIRESFDADFQRVTVLIDRGETKEAREILNELLSIDPEHPRLLNALASTYYIEHDADNAERIFRQIIDIAPDFSPPYCNLCMLYSSLGREVDAAKYADLTIESNPHSAATWSTLGLYYMDSGDNETALEYFLAANTLDPEFLIATYNIACAYAKLGDNEKALPYLEESLSFINNYLKALDDNDLDPIRELPEFEEVMREAEKMHSDDFSGTPKAIGKKNGGGNSIKELIIRNLNPDNDYYVSTCTHVNESDETDASAARRLAWFKRMYEKGVRAKAAMVDGEMAGFIYVMPIEVCPWGPLGEGLAVIPCLTVPKTAAGKGIGEALLVAAEDEAREQGKKGLVIQAYYGDFWFMPAPYFEKRGYLFADGSRDDGGSALLCKRFDDEAEPPRMLKPNYNFQPVEGKMVVDLFYNTFCLTSDTEAQRVREVAAEFGDAVILNEYPGDDPDVLRRYQIPRGIYVNGEWISWGYEAPREGIREAIEGALTIG